MTDTALTTAPTLSAATGSPLVAGSAFATGVPATDDSNVKRLLEGLRQSAPTTDRGGIASDDVRFENELAVVRLGMATSLFYSLRTKHAPTAGHCLRVALSCSAWAQRLGLDDASRDRIEVAALLHDLGKIGIPDRILRKPGKLSVDEQLSMELIPELGCEILRGCTSDMELLDMIRYANVWFDSRRHGDGPRGNAIPIGSRMLAIADAFDSMTTDTVYRPALSRERAVQELMQGADTQFDPELTGDFSRMLEQRPEMLHQIVVDRWLRQLKQSDNATVWGSTLRRDSAGNTVANESSPLPSSSVGDGGESFRRETLFYKQLSGNMKDGVVFTDAEGTITHWNAAMQRLTSIAADAIVGQTWTSESLRLRNQDSTRDIDDCLVRECLNGSACVVRTMMIEQPGHPSTPVQLQVTPVTAAVPGIHGTIVIVRDLSDQTTLQEKLESLHLQTTRDPLTGVANRAHFDNVLADLAAEASGGGKSFSLIMCDIDHFKQVNDVHGHPAGDEALKMFASVLVKHSRDGDTVARYGGEEFLLITPNCDNATAANRAEAIRAALELTPLPSLGNEAVTASFGVTEFQAGDSAETILARSDRALLKAKDNGRNRVIQFGAGNKMQPPADQVTMTRTFLSWLTGSSQQASGEFDIVTPVPVDLAIEKLRGFIADHHAEIISVDENQLSMKLNAFYSRGGRRRADQQMQIRVNLTLSESCGDGEPRRGVRRTNVHVHLQPIRNRDRRGEEVQACFSQVINSLRSYLMGELKVSEPV